MLESIEYSLQKLFKDNGISVAISQPKDESYISCISLSDIDIDAESFNGYVYEGTYHFMLNIVASSHEEMLDLLEKYLVIRELKSKPFTIYDFHTGKAVKNIECNLSMPSKIMFDAPFSTAFIDELLVTVRLIS